MTAPARTLGLLFVLSLALRLMLYAAVVRAGTPLAFDELGYYERAVAYREVLVDLSRLRAPAAEALSAAYGRGHWPPLHPLLLGAWLTPVEPTPDVARLLMVLVSALTTPLVYRLTRELAGEREAWAAAICHLLYPTFCAYSHYLWSETTYVFLLLAAVLSAVRVGAAETRGGRSARAALTGALLGLVLLTRAAALPLLLVVPAWLWASLRRRRRHAAAAAGVALAASLAVAAPWQMALTANEGRPVPVTTLGGFNLALGNNPWVPEGYGSSWGHETSKAHLFAAMEEIAQAESISWEAAGFRLAKAEIRKRPGAFLRRALERLRMLWAPDSFPLRHLLNAVYPPLPMWLSGLLCLVLAASYLALLAASVLGLGFAFRARGLILAMVLVAMAPPALTFGMSRLHVPLLALLLPAAGCATAAVLSGGLARLRPPAVIAAVLISSLSLSSLPRVVELYLIPSSYYAPLVGRAGGSGVIYSDRVAVRGFSGELELELLGDGAKFSDGGRRKRLPSPGTGSHLLEVFSVAGSGPLEVRVANGGCGSRLFPIVREAWRRWRPAGACAAEYQWAGGGSSPR